MSRAHHDADIRRALAAAAAQEAPCDTTALQRRIERSAGPALFQRRHRAATVFEYIAHWSLLLMPAGIACALGAAGLLSLRSAHQPVAVNPDVLLMGAATNHISAPQLVDYMLGE
jgi:hypothetical protein